MCHSVTRSILVLFLLVGCGPSSAGSSPESTSAAEYPLAAAVLDLASMASPNSPVSTYFSAAVPFPPVAALRVAIDERDGVVLLNRGEAHVTTLTPQEVTALKRRLAATEIFDLADGTTIQGEAIEIVCVGRGHKASAGASLSTYFLVIRSDGIFARRRAVAAAFRRAGGTPVEFDSERYYPHITIGFTKTDLHEQDGVIKDERSCVAPVALTGR